MAKSKVNQKGFTLMEVLVSIAIVGIIFLPLLSAFSDSAKINNISAKKLQRSTTAAQTVMEEIRSYDSIETLVNLYEDTANNGGKMMRTDETFHNAYTSSIKANDGTFNNKKYYFVKKGIESDGKKFNARITVDTSKYQTLNDEGVPVIESLGAGSTIMASEQADQIQSVLQDLANNDKYASYSVNQLANNLKKIIHIEISDTAIDAATGMNMISDGMVRVKIQNVYKISIGGSTETFSDFEPLYNEEVVLENLKGIYLFYNYEMYSDTENIFQEIELDVNYNHTTLDKNNFTFYGLCQQVYTVNNKTSQTTDIDNFLASKNVKPEIINNTDIDIFSNINYSENVNGATRDGIGEDMDNIVREEKIQRLAEVTVEVYESEDTTYSKPIATLTSTRGE